MCTLVLLRRPEHAWPLIVAANRDELASRAARPPARHWPDRPEVVGGLDVSGHGSWMALNDWGVMAAILNRRGTLGPQEGMRSRGEIVLDALDHADARDAAEAAAAIDPRAYRPFNLILADTRDAYWIRHAGDGAITRRELREGLSMITAGELDDPTSGRVRLYKPLFERAPAPDPKSGDWSDWQLLLSSRRGESREPGDAMNIVSESEFGTRSSSLLALPAPALYEGERAAPIWLFADGRPDEVEFLPVEL